MENYFDGLGIELAQQVKRASQTEVDLTLSADTLSADTLSADTLSADTVEIAGFELPLLHHLQVFENTYGHYLTEIYDDIYSEARFWSEECQDELGKDDVGYDEAFAAYARARAAATVLQLVDAARGGIQRAVELERQDLRKIEKEI